MELIYGVKQELGYKLLDELLYYEIANKNLSSNLTLNFKLFENTLTND